MNLKIKKEFLVSLCLFSIPFLIGFQPFLPRILELIVILLKLILIPLYIFFSTKNKYKNIWFLLNLLIIIISTVFVKVYDINDFKLYVLSILVSILYFNWGSLIAKTQKGEKYIWLFYGVIFFNLCSLLIYFLISIGVINIFTLYSKINREDDIDLFRFALGNAIELPFTISCLLFIALVLMGNTKRNLIFATALNLLMALISQSRVVVLIALFLFISEFSKLRLLDKIKFSAFTILLGIIFFATQFSEIINSLSERIAGNDSGSQNERIFLLNSFKNNFSSYKIFFGNGPTESSYLVKKITGGYRSIESVFLQLSFDFGLVGLFLFFAPILILNTKYLFHGKYQIALLLVFIQILFFLPVYTSMITVFFLFGVCSNYRHEF